MTQAHENARQVMSGLKDFQRATVDYVFRRMYLDAPPMHRFLVADEVGLGKTLIAAGVMAQAIAHLQAKSSPVNVIYICSNADIASQNLASLKFPGIKVHRPTRITLLPTILGELRGKTQANLIALTPGTSFGVSQSAGRVDERALLYVLTQKIWHYRDRRDSRNVFRADAYDASFERAVSDMRRKQAAGGIDARAVRAINQAFRSEGGRGKASLKSRFEDLADRFGRRRDMRNASEDLKRDARRFVGELRGVLVRTCLGMLQPDVIILDEFQRFKNLLDTDSENEDAQLARELFNYQHEQSRARVLLLSATPYKMYTLSAESALGQEDHYSDFVQTTAFLHGSEADGMARQARFVDTLGAFRKALTQLDPLSLDACRAVRQDLEQKLRQIMVRTERLAVSADRSGMLVERELPNVALQADEVLAYGALQSVRKAAGGEDTLEYWKSAPYVLNFMDKEGYALKARVMAVTEQDKRAVRQVLNNQPMLTMPWAAYQDYNKIDPPNARMRALIQDVIQTRKLWQLLWMPPSLPYTKPAGAYEGLDFAGTTKRLVFTAWKMAPRAISALLTYEAERCIVEKSGEKGIHNTPEDRAKRSPRLVFALADNEPAAMSLMALYYPSMTLASLCDPLAHRGQAIQAVMAQFESAISNALSDAGLDRLVIPGRRVDEAWYWAAPVLLDLARFADATRDWLAQSTLAADWAAESGDEDRRVWPRHVAELQTRLLQAKPKLGAMPKDLARVLAGIALAGPSVCMLRSLCRVLGQPIGEGVSRAILTAAGAGGLSMRSLFNQPEAMSLVRTLHDDESEPYWQRTLTYSAEGNLQAVLDEYVHLLRDKGGASADADDAAREISSQVRSVLTLRTANNRIDRMHPADIGADKPKQESMRMRFAMRYGNERLDDDFNLRAESVRRAFNSPFQPFVLTTTSVGQEGLDFHRYCHAVVHWNLPSNPVDMEQREGRIHRYKGHAVRKNVALSYGLLSQSESESDPWRQLFADALADRAVDQSDITPYWVYAHEQGSRIERYVPALPLSRDTQVYSDLRQSLAAYRMVFGQSRQQELLHFLSTRINPAQLAEVIDTLRVNLEPDAAVVITRRR